jgi:hypothetical protein
MDGKNRWGRACRIAARRRFIDAPKLPVPQHYPRLPYGFASPPSVGKKIPSAQYGGDTAVTLPAADTLWVLGRNPMKNKTLTSAVVDLAA